MAKVTSPLMSLDACGSVASTIVFSKWKGRNYVRQHVIPANPQSSGQQTARSGLGAAGRFNSFIAPASVAQGALNALAPSGQSGVSYFAKQQIERMAASTSDYNNGTYSTQKGYFDTAAASLGILDVTIPGATPLVVPAGLILWNANQAAYSVDPTLAANPSRTATSTTISNFVATLS